MSSGKNIERICIGILIITVLITVLFMNGQRLGMDVIVDEDSETYTGSKYFTSKDMNTDWNNVDTVKITLDDSGIKIDGNGAYTYDGSVYISQSGYFELSGTLSDGSIVVDAYDSSKVWLLFNGVEVNCRDNAALQILQADKVFVTLAEGSVNSLSGSSEFSEEATEAGAGGTVFARDDLTINGSGSLFITGDYRHGIEANDDLVITGGAIEITAQQDGINANDSVRITGETDLTIDAKDEGIAVTGENGYFYIENGKVNITSLSDGVHASGDVTLAGGEITIDSGDDGLHSDADTLISEGILYISDCYEGIEALTIELSGGEVTIFSTDDGLNANGGSGGFNFGKGADPGTGTEPEAENDTSVKESQEEESWIRISGGNLTIVNETGNDADGIDSNGSIYISGGRIYVSLVGTGSNSALDCGSENGGVCEITGGTVIACGASAMAEGFDSSSEQASILYNVSEAVDAGTGVSLMDKEGNVLLTYEVPASFTSVVLSCPQLTVGESYQIVMGGQSETVELSEISTTAGDAAAGGMPGGSRNRGGMGPGAGFGTGGHRGWQQENSADPGNASENNGGAEGGNGERPEFNGEMPEFNGEMPEFNGEMPEFNGEMPEFNGEMPEFNGEMPAPPDRNGGPGEKADPAQAEEADPEETVQNDSRKSLSEFDPTVWYYLGLSFLALICGVLFSKRIPGRF